MQASHLPTALPRHHQNPLICKCVWPLRVSEKGLWIHTGREERECHSPLRASQKGLSYGAQMLAAAGGAAFLLLLLQTRPGPPQPRRGRSVGAQLHRISISAANRRRGRWRPAHLRPDRALLRFVMLASPLNPPFYFLVPLPFVLLRGEGGAAFRLGKLRSRARRGKPQASLERAILF